MFSSCSSRVGPGGSACVFELGLGLAMTSAMSVIRTLETSPGVGGQPGGPLPDQGYVWRATEAHRPIPTAFAVCRPAGPGLGLDVLFSITLCAAFAHREQDRSGRAQPARRGTRVGASSGPHRSWAVGPG